MASQTEELRAAMLARLRASEVFAKAAGAISDHQPAEFPSAWVGVTESKTEGNDELTEVLATVHIWNRSGRDGAARLAAEARAIFHEPPSVKSLSLVSWVSDFMEVRLDDEHLAYRGLVRFRAQARPQD